MTSTGSSVLPQHLASSTKGIKSFPVTYVTDIRSLIVIPERAMSSTVEATRKEKTARARPMSIEKKSNFEMNDDILTDMSHLLYMQNRANHICIAPRPPENTVSHNAMPGGGTLHTNIHNARKRKSSSDGKIATAPTLPVATFNSHYMVTDASEGAVEGMVGSQVRRKIHGNQDCSTADHAKRQLHKHISNANTSQSHISTTSITSSETNHQNYDNTSRVTLSKPTMKENENDTSHPKVPNAIYKEEINSVYDVVLGRPGVTLRRPLVGRLSDQGTHVFSSPTSTSFDTDHSNASSYDTFTSTHEGKSLFSVGQTMSVFDTTLVEWWEKYELASHVDKVHIAKLCIEDMVRKGCRFLQKMDDGTRNGYYTVVPPHNDSIRKKVLRALRQVVLHRLETFTEDERSRHKMKIKEQRAYIRSQEFKQRVSTCVGQIQQGLSESKAKHFLKSTTNTITKAARCTENNGASEETASTPMEATLSPVIQQDVNLPEYEPTAG
jgi:hypothetical protein